MLTFLGTIGLVFVAICVAVAALCFVAIFGFAFWKYWKSPGTDKTLQGGLDAGRAAVEESPLVQETSSFAMSAVQNGLIIEGYLNSDPAAAAVKISSIFRNQNFINTANEIMTVVNNHYTRVSTNLNAQNVTAPTASPSSPAAAQVVAPVFLPPPIAAPQLVQPIQPIQPLAPAIQPLA